MKRSPMPQRKTRMPRGKPLAAVGKGLASRKARTRKARSSAHTKQWRLDVLARDGHRCTALLLLGRGPMLLTVFADADLFDGRCEATEDLHVHHVTSKRMGAELLEDGVTLCQPHHEYIESQLRWYRKVRP